MAKLMKECDSIPDPLQRRTSRPHPSDHTLVEGSQGPHRPWRFYSNRGALS
jgi:hypothetical protein